MVSRYRGKVGEYLWEKEKERFERYKDRPWELQSKQHTVGDMLFVFGVIFAGVLAALVLFSVL